jgi:flagellar hook-associated protein 2
MSGIFSAGGLITGLDSNSLIAQLMQIERQPVVRLEQRITDLQTQQRAVRDFRNTVTTLRNRVQDFRLNDLFGSFRSASSEPKVLSTSISSTSPVTGSFEINVLQLASATVAQSSAKLGATIDPDAALNDSGMAGEILSGSFSVNGVVFTVDPSTQSLNDILGEINASSAGVTATYDAVMDKVTFENTTPGDTSVINFTATDDTTQLLAALSVTQATQYTGGNGSTVVTSTRNLGSLNTSVTLEQSNFAAGPVSSGIFTINGVAISIDATEDTLSSILGRINSSGAGVTASYDASSDAIRLVSNTLGGRTIRFGAVGDTSNFLSVANLDTATQTAGKDAQFTINGGPTLSRNSNEVSDAVSGVTLSLLSAGLSTVTVSTDDDAVVNGFQELVAAYNDVLNQVRLFAGNDGALRNDNGLRTIENFIRSDIFRQVEGITGNFKSLVDIGLSTGEDFDSSATQQLSLKEDVLREALRQNRDNVKTVLSNAAKTGIADTMYTFLDEATRTTGFLNNRAKTGGTIDLQIRGLNERIDRYDELLNQRETRLRKQFTQLEQLASNFQSHASALSNLGQSILFKS